jgi:hypothetical protein
LRKVLAFEFNPTQGVKMSVMTDLGIDNIEVDLNNLYRDEMITDRKVAQLRRMIPITATGADDPTRKTLYTGSTQIMLPTGALPIYAEIQADSLEAALEMLPDALKQSIEDMVQRAHEMQRQEAKRIVTPDEFNKKGGGIII